MLRCLETMLLDSDLDLSLSTIDRTDPQLLRVISRPGWVRVGFGLLFAIPCFLLLRFGFEEGNAALLLPAVFCPALAFLSVLFGLSVQEKSFHPSARKAILTCRVLWWKHQRVCTLPQRGVLLLSRRSSTGDTICYYYEVHIEGLEGYGFTIATDEKRRNAFAQELSAFLGYSLRSAV